MHKFVEIAPLPPAPDPHERFMLLLQAHADGTLREQFSVREGTLGWLGATQVGLFPLDKGATADGWPANHINLKVVGR